MDYDTRYNLEVYGVLYNNYLFSIAVIKKNLNNFDNIPNACVQLLVLKLLFIDIFIKKKNFYIKSFVFCTSLLDKFKYYRSPLKFPHFGKLVGGGGISSSSPILNTVAIPTSTWKSR